jgi:hypothetical protein
VLRLKLSSGNAGKPDTVSFMRLARALQGDQDGTSNNVTQQDIPDSDWEINGFNKRMVRECIDVDRLDSGTLSTVVNHDRQT